LLLIERILQTKAAFGQFLLAAQEPLLARQSFLHRNALKAVISHNEAA
jgi:hypothetical protein